MKVIRYSFYGFKPQEQTHHMEGVNYHLYRFDINDYPEHLRYNIQKIHERCVDFYLQHLEDLKCGVWCYKPLSIPSISITIFFLIDSFLCNYTIIIQVLL